MTNEHRFENCSFARSLDLLGDRWTFLVLREAFFGVRRFGQLARTLGVSRNILSDRLQKLVANGILERRIYRHDPDRYEYRLTQTGKDLYQPIVAILRWGDEHLSGPEGPPLVLRHETCGHDSAPLLVCAHCREPIRPEDMRPEPGPGAYAVTRDTSAH